MSLAGPYLGIGRHGVGRDNPAIVAERVGNVVLVKAGSVLEGEGHEGHPDVLGEDREVARCNNGLPQVRRLRRAALHDRLVPLRPPHAQ